jgi:protein-arginine kinase activator protein McsA
MEERKCKNCRKTFTPIRWSQKFCSEKCYLKYNDKLRARRVKKLLTCDFCKTKFSSRSQTRFCCSECKEKMICIATRIRNLFFFETKTCMEQLDRLEKLGFNYRFPAPHEDFNQMYNLTHPLEGCNDG